MRGALSFAVLLVHASALALVVADEPEPDPIASLSPPPDLEVVSDETWATIEDDDSPPLVARESTARRRRRERARTTTTPTVDPSLDLPPPIDLNESQVDGDAVAKAIDRWIVAQLPREYVNTKKWNRKKRMAVGLKVELDGAQLETRRRYKEVNHGAWTMYKIWLIDPDKEFKLRFENVRELPAGSVGFDLVVDAKTYVFGRVAQWERGVQLYSLSAEAEADLRLVVRGECKTRLDLGESAGVRLEPKANDAELEIKRFRLRRISAAAGPVVKSLSATVREWLEEAVEDNRRKLVDKLNQQIEKNRDKLVFSPTQSIDSKVGTWLKALGAGERPNESGE